MLPSLSGLRQHPEVSTGGVGVNHPGYNIIKTNKERLEWLRNQIKMEEEQIAMHRERRKAAIDLQDRLRSFDGSRPPQLSKEREEYYQAGVRITEADRFIKLFEDSISKCRNAIGEIERQEAKAKKKAEEEAAAKKAAKKAAEEELVAKNMYNVLVQKFNAAPIEPELPFQVVLRWSSKERFQAIKKLFANVNPDDLKYFSAHGKDQVEGGNYNTLTPIGVFDVHYGDVNLRRKVYLATRRAMRIADECNEYGTPLECVRTDKALASVAKDDYFPELQKSVNEKLLLHGTNVMTLPKILGGGFDRRYADPKHQAYGFANYQAEDPGKADQYVLADNYEAFNVKLGLPITRRTYYMLVSRTLLGCANHVPHKGGKTDLKGKKAYNALELLRLPYDSLVVEHGSALRGGYVNKHYREFLVQKDTNILPVMLVAYVRDNRASPPSFDPSVLGCP